MTLHLTNTLTRRKAAFEPLDPANVRVYVCGPTVYDLAHVGNARPVVAFDVLFRLLRHVYGPDHVTYARNITDVDDKIIAAAKESGEPIAALTARTTQAFHEDMAALGTLDPTVEPRATEHIAQMIALTQRLLETGHAYPANGHVLFSVPSMPEYGRLSRRDREEMIAGARVEVAPYKHDPADFVLWKPSTPEQPGWDSPWGRGRPGWHLECSAMSAHHLGQPFDIHGGGQDLVFPHHENEIAQSAAACGGHAEDFARVWLHNGYLVLGGEKMAKSVGNILTVRQLLEEGWPGEAIRLTLLSAQYRQPLDFTRDKLKESKAQLDRLYGALRHAAGAEAAEAAPAKGVLAALADDLNTPEALAELHERGTALNKADQAKERARLKGELLASGALLGLLDKDPEVWFKGQGLEEDVRLKLRFGMSAEAETIRNERWINDRLTERAEARRVKDFAKADQIREELSAYGIILEDRPDGTTDWRRA